MQEGDDPKWPLKIHATLKHYTVCRAPPSPPDGALDSSPCMQAYSVETNRFGFIGNASTYDVYDSFLPQYAAAFEQGHAVRFPSLT